MTEYEWTEGVDPDVLLDFLQNTATERKLRLFACACCRRIGHLLTDDRAQRLVELSEQFADGLVDRGLLTPAAEAVAEGWVLFRSAAAEAAWATAWARTYTHAAGAAARAAAAAAAARAGQGEKSPHTAWLEARAAEAVALAEERARQCDVLREVFGNPFRPVTMAAAWRSAPEVVRLAGMIYKWRQFDEMPRLADALAAAGCAEREVLEHCRAPVEHFPGCWVVDALLGKT